MPEKILIAGYVGFGNAGDEAIAQVITGHLREEMPGAEITIVSGDTRHTRDAYGVRAIGWRDPLAIAEAVRHTDLTILGGGGLFQDYWGFDPSTILTREHWGLSFYVAPALLSAIYGKPLMLYAVGAGPLLSEHGRKYTKVAGDIATRITVRDEGSKELFTSLGVSAEKITLTADPAFDLTPSAEAAEWEEIRDWKSRTPAIAVCLRTWNFGADSTYCDREIAKALDEVMEREAGRVLFVPFEGGDDVFVAKRVIGQMRYKECASVLTRACTPAGIAGILGRADLVLGMRLHSVIFSLAATVPFVALEYDPKVGGLAALTGLQEYTLPFGGIESHVLAERMRQALRESARFREVEGRAIGGLRVKARENAAIAAELLRSGVAAATDYGADARLLMGRLVTAQVAGTEQMVGRMAECGEALGLRVAGMRPLEMADGVVRKAREVGTRVGDLEAGLAGAREDRDRFECELADAQEAAEANRKSWETARRETEEAREYFARESRRTEQLTLDLERAGAQIAALTEKLAGCEATQSKSFGSVTKRGLQVALDLFQLLTPSPLRAAVRKYYLNWFYFRIYPERRPGL